MNNQDNRIARLPLLTDAASKVCTWTLLIATLLIPSNVLARNLTEIEMSTLKVVTQEFESAISANDYRGIFKAMPSRMATRLAQKGGMTEEQLIQSFSEVLQKTLEKVSIVSFKMDLNGADATSSPDGRSYVFVPTQTILDVVGDKRYSVESQTLAFEDEGRWYLVRVSDVQQVALLVEVYPEFKNVKFPGDSWEVVEE